DVVMVVANTGAEWMRGVAASALDTTGTAGVTLVSGPLPATLDVAPGARDTIRWTWQADAIGDVRFAGDATGTGDSSGVVRTTPRVTSSLDHVLVAAQHVDLTPVQTMPIRVNRGQTGVVPFSLTLVNPGGSDVSDVRVDELRLRLEDGSGLAVV